MGPAIGIVGGGQLAWMLAEAAQRRQIALQVQTPSTDDPAAALAAGVVEAAVRDVAGTAELATRCSAISFENEWIDLEGLAPLEAQGVQFVPSLSALQPLVCKRNQRELLRRLNLPSPRWFPLTAACPPKSTPVTSAPPRSQAVCPEGFSFPLMAKAATGGYDGKGTAILQGLDDLAALIARVDPENWIVEEFVAFEQELALVAARDRFGEVVCLPLVQTHQHQQVCDWVLAPVEASHALQQAARNIAASLLTSLDYVGVLSLEFFYGRQGLLINELAPRTHNSGHYSIEASSCSQFDLQLLSVSGQAVPEPSLQVPGALMVNLLGFERRSADDPEADYGRQRHALASLDDAHLHWYGKRGSSLGRKLGHLTVLLRSSEAQQRRQEAMERLQQIRAIWPLPEETVAA
ncbi:5-(carboxyamino)imidazole ribonucleotide synthase [Synechococcus sp. W4D4]|uniref:5-(carboxyamino)imidazole ribonucleotide synthase n=1 Tax=Synechococcus sp. W4D4 TaxID=3392294 RepID=UPI0039ECC1B1